MKYVMALVVLLVAAATVWRLRRATLVWKRLNEETVVESPRPGMAKRGWLANWLFRAGYRQQYAAALFLAATILMAFIGIVLIVVCIRTGLVAQSTDLLYSIPGGVGNVLVPFALATPWFALIVICLLPLLVVRAARRRRATNIQQDLPLFLDLLNALAGAGIGFDEALDRILNMQSSNRPLAQEFRMFQYDTLAGRSRIESLKGLMDRVNLPIFASFVSALIQAEQSGGALADTLKTQASEIRSRRRELANAAAMAVPTKLVLPMVIGFLPGIFVVLLGPMIMEAFAVMGQSMRTAAGQ